jgi:uncharacterized protein (DUF305 family)
VGGIATVHNGWDIGYVDWMVPHDAVDSQYVELAPTRASSQAVKDIAAQIDTPTQTRFLKFTTLVNAWGVPMPSTDPSVTAGGHDHGGGSPGETAAQLEADLAKLSGVAFDKQFLRLMIADMGAALPEATSLIQNGVNPQDKQVAQDVITVQTRQLDQMRQLASAM